MAAMLREFTQGVQVDSFTANSARVACEDGAPRFADAADPQD